MDRNKILAFGCGILQVFMVAVTLCIVYFIAGFMGKVPGRGSLLAEPVFWIARGLLAVFLLAILFWLGIICVYLTSVQLGIKWRILGIVCGWIPFVNVVMLCKIVAVCRREAVVERDKKEWNQLRIEDKVCQTKYPIFMVHGVFFRDFKHLNYWGRVPEELIKNGATIYYGNHNSAASVEDSAKELAARIRDIVQSTGCEKVNVIAHSKGGLDIRTAVVTEGVADYVASITTINTPHRGCEFADYLLEKIPEKQQKKLAKGYNAAAAKLGDVNPNFLAAVYDLTSARCRERNERVVDVPEIYYQSIGSKLNRPTSGRFPLNMTYLFVKHFDGPNDGLVGERSFPWGSSYEFLTTEGVRGISHGDMIDLNRENIKGFDVREFYVRLVIGLKNKGF